MVGNELEAAASQREHPHLARGAGGGRVNVKPHVDALVLQEDAARTMADDLRTQIEEPQGTFLAYCVVLTA